MRIFIFLITLTIFSSWIGLGGLLLGYIDFEGMKLGLPTNTAEFGDSTNVLNGLFSSFAVVLALVAVLLQGRELKESTKAQNEQAEALKKQLVHQQELTKAELIRSQAIVDQLKQQQTANQILLLQAQLQYHTGEISRMDIILDKYDGNFEKSDLYNGSRNKKQEHLASLRSLKQKIEKLENA